MAKAKENIGRKKRINTRTERMEADMQEKTISGHSRKCPRQRDNPIKRKRTKNIATVANFIKIGFSITPMNVRKSHLSMARTRKIVKSVLCS